MIETRFDCLFAVAFCECARDAFVAIFLEKKYLFRIPFETDKIF